MNEPEESAPHSTAGIGVSGGCAFGCACLFALLAISFVVTAFIQHEPVWPPFAPAPYIIFIGGNILAFIALASKSASIRRAGTIALRILWLSLVLLVILGYVRDRSGVPSPH